MLTAEQSEALRDLGSRMRRHAQAADAYEDLLCAEAAKLFLAGAREFRAGDIAARKSAFDDFLCMLPPLSPAAFAAQVEREAELYKEELAALSPLPATEKCALTESRFAPALRAAFPDGTSFVFCAGFEEACEKAADGAVDGCLLPLLDGGGRILARSERLAGENGLKCRRLITPDVDEEQLTFGLFSPVLYDLPDPVGAAISFSADRPGGDEEKLWALCRICRLTLSVFARRGRTLALFSALERGAPGGKEALLRALAASKMLLRDVVPEGLFD